ncbi:MULTISPECIES: CBS domain-containing protein [Thermus]|uniref:GGDEF domain-containing protein n=2 Tax=Thermus scotoductus TaxID=37636 RepID=A0A348XRE9_THESC|nr:MULTISPECIES: CBS domain-containing protein [Thermus]RTG96842.1 GGDEF domain-containing protein [Thermus scotoductus]RTH00176.1 GGDEF domain-containing protein [Thermus scotoductus]RTH26160.1 GGDEF domain-containing protein [Thermus scotoductus]RTH96133.1 GGDEF domain-containing protein [Thermus scotoductus]RTI23721.1 GGDEF domain-containing protein [Thermus scotoductus]
MVQVKEVMTSAPVTIRPWASVREAANLMAQHRIGSLPVLEDGTLVGVIISRDLRGVHPNRVVMDVLRGPPIFISPKASLLEAQALMQEKGVERLLVVEEGRLLGILTKRALAFALGQGFDPLTGLPRADFLRSHLERLMDKGIDPTLVFVDLDDFGLLNKQLGHTAGDQALKEVASRLSAFARKHRGEAFRYAGDEFALVFPRPRARALPHLPELLKLPLRVGEKRLGLSLGVAGGRRRKKRPGSSRATADDLIRLASLASTLAKGRPEKMALGEEVNLPNTRALEAESFPGSGR